MPKPASLSSGASNRMTPSCNSGWTALATSSTDLSPSTTCSPVTSPTSPDFIDHGGGGADRRCEPRATAPYLTCVVDPSAVSSKPDDAVLAGELLCGQQGVQGIAQVDKSARCSRIPLSQDENEPTVGGA